MAQPTKTIYTISDIYALPDGERAELIDGRGCNGAPDWIIGILQNGSSMSSIFRH